MGKITHLDIQKWIKEKNPVAVSDGDGLTFTLSATGRTSWVLRYRHAGKGREKTLGHYPDLGIADARKLAAEDRVRISQGVDVAAEKQRKKREAAGAWTVRELAEDYLQKASGRLETSTLDGQRQRLRDYVYPSIGNVPAVEIRPSELVQIVERVSKKSLHIARLVLGEIRSVFAHGLGRHVIEFDPASQVKANAVIGPRPVARTRVMLSEDELRFMLPLLPKLGPQNALMVKVLLGTALRIGELIAARWSNIDFTKRTWVIPAEDIKGKKGKARNGEDVKNFVLPLTDQVVLCLLDLKDMAFGSEFVLPIRSRKKAVGDAHMEPSTFNAALDKFWKTYLGDSCQRFTPHDLRSTARSHLGRLGVDLLIAERCLNHSLGGLVAIYDQHDYLDVRRQALEKWSEFLAVLEYGDIETVLALGRKTVVLPSDQEVVDD